MASFEDEVLECTGFSMGDLLIGNYEDARFGNVVLRRDTHVLQGLSQVDYVVYLGGTDAWEAGINDLQSWRFVSVLFEDGDECRCCCCTGSCSMED